ncbi:hypothetical protein D3C71_1806050 [compost metagenome]
MPAVLLTASGRLVMSWSSIRWRVSTVTDCGMSLSACVVLPMVTAGDVYEPVPSVVGL